ncbi:MAG: putative Zn-dependent protease [Bacteriovoracaceae bacterium]
MRLLLALIAISIGQVQAVYHLPLEMSFEEYQNLYSELKQTKSAIIKDEYVRESIDGGEKMSSWIKLINSSRTEENAIRLTSKGTQRGIPIETPSKYGPSTIKANLLKLKKEMPKELVSVIFGENDITKTPMINDAEFIKWCRKVSGNYQSAVRWTGMQKWLSHYAKRKAQDVRGFYFLRNLENLDEHLNKFGELNPDKASTIKEALIGICLNSGKTKKSCERKITKAIKKKDLVSFKNSYWTTAINNWNGFYEITNPRKDVVWTKKSPGVMAVVFKDPKNPEIANWLKDNIEDEFQLTEKNWALELNFVPGKAGTAYIEFQKNVTPHVSGGNKVVMDANTELEEYGVKWTIRHEFGHILRIPDCYHEFYDKEENLMINYQLDVTDLMCSRAGAMNERIYKELEKHYMK